MKRKLCSIALVFVMLLTLAACGEKKSNTPTVEELRSGIQALDLNKYQDIALDMNIYSHVDDGDVALGLNMGVEMSGPVVHIYDAQMSMNMGGLSFTVGLEGWSDTDARVSYSRVTGLNEDSGWTKVDLGDDYEETQGLTGDIADIVEMLSHVDNVESMVLEEHSDGEDYVLTWNMDGGDFDAALGGLLSSYTGVDTSFDAAKGHARFDESSRNLKSLSVETLDDSNTGFMLEIKFMAMNGSDNLAVPQEVIDVAIDTGDIGDYDYDPDGSVVSYDDVELNAGEGEDEILDPMALSIAAADPDNYGLYLNHYDGMSSVQYLTGDDKWSGMLIVEHIDADNWATSAEAEFDIKLEWLNSWYNTDPAEGSVDSQYVVYYNLEEGRYEMDFAKWYDDMYISVSVYAYDSTDSATLRGHISDMLQAAGLE